MQMRKLVLLCVIAIFGSLQNAFSQDVDILKGELARLQGSWKLENYEVMHPKNLFSVEYGGRFRGEMRIEGLKAQLDIKLLRFPELSLRPDLVIRPSLCPKEWDFVYTHNDDADTKTTKYIYSLEGDRLILCRFSSPNSTGRPRVFSKPVDESQIKMTWVRSAAK